MRHFYFAVLRLHSIFLRPFGEAREAEKVSRGGGGRDRKTHSRKPIKCEMISNAKELEILKNAGEKAFRDRRALIRRRTKRDLMNE